MNLWANKQASRRDAVLPTRPHTFIHATVCPCDSMYTPFSDMISSRKSVSACGDEGEGVGMA